MIPKTAEDAFRAVVLAVALGVLVGRWVDLYFMILPPLGRGPMPAFGVVEAGLAAGGVGVFLLVVPRELGKASLLPSKDPFLVESLPHAEMYRGCPSCHDGSQSRILQENVSSHEAHFIRDS